MAKKIEGKQVSVFVSDDTMAMVERGRDAQKYPPSTARMLSVCLEDGAKLMMADVEKDAATAIDAKSAKPSK